MRRIKKIHQAINAPMEGLSTFRALPTREINHMDPFLFLNHHGPQVFPPANRGLPFGPHPHRGFETLTFIFKGDITHGDTTGVRSVIRTGGIQWMTAGRGIIHTEVSSDEFKEKGGEVELIQLWLNLPARLKMAPPHYIGLQKEEIPSLLLDNGKVIINIVSGSWGEVKGPVPSLTDIHMASLDLKKDGKFNTVIDSNHTILFYVVKGKIKVNHENATKHNLVEFTNEGKEIQVEALEDSVLILGHGEPYHEPIVAHGPFVMNSQTEIMQAIKDYQTGKMGVWID